MERQNELERIIKLVDENPTHLTHSSGDIYQISPQKRMRSIGKILLDLNLPKQQATAIDIGTGFGYGAVALNALGYTAIGIEVNKEKLRQGIKYWQELGLNPLIINNYSEVQQNTSGLYFMQRDSSNILDFPNSSIDFATSFFIGWYMLKGRGAFSDIGRVLNSQGELIITTEGPTHRFVPKMIRGCVVKIASSLTKLPNLKLKAIQKIGGAEVYDKYVIREEKS